eukprot:jgi/Mesen1/8346/ME000463S07802
MLGSPSTLTQGFPTREIEDKETDPFLLLHEFGPTEYQPGSAKGAPDHPHRGFETVTYIIEGSHEHKDSSGARGKLGTGDVQWMTAGSGVVHSEMPSREIQEKGGRVHGFQIWVNLPRKDKMIAPRYQDVPSGSIPIATSEDGKVWVKVVAGEAMGRTAVIETHTPIVFLHIKLQPGGEFEQVLPSAYHGLAYVFGGRGVVGAKKTPIKKHQVASLSPNGDSVYFGNPADSADGPMDVLLLGGQPIREPVARYGPFVMNTVEELQQAFSDFRSGKMGQIHH